VGISSEGTKLYPANTSTHTSSHSHRWIDTMEEDVNEGEEERKRLNEEEETRRRKVLVNAAHEAANKYHTNTEVRASSPNAKLDTIVVDSGDVRDEVDEIEEFTSDGENEMTDGELKDNRKGKTEDKRRSGGSGKIVRGRGKKAKVVLSEDEDCHMER
jgi:hypothetical protein